MDLVLGGSSSFSRCPSLATGSGSDLHPHFFSAQHPSWWTYPSPYMVISPCVISHKPLLCIACLGSLRLPLSLFLLPQDRLTLDNISAPWVQSVSPPPQACCLACIIWRSSLFYFDIGDLIRWLEGVYIHDHIPMAPSRLSVIAHTFRVRLPRTTITPYILEHLINSIIKDLNLLGTNVKAKHTPAYSSRILHMYSKSEASETSFK